VESRWNHLDGRGRVFSTPNYKRAAAPGTLRAATLDWGWMQINEKLASLDAEDWDLERIKNDPEYNLRAAIATLESKQRYLQRLRRKANWPVIEARYRLKGHSSLDILLKAYNGFQPSWAYVHRVQAALAEKPWERAMLAQVANAALRPQTGLSGPGICRPASGPGSDPSAKLLCVRGLASEGSDRTDPVYSWPQVLE